MEGYVDTGKADRSVWLMKSPAVVSRSLQNNDNSNGNPSTSLPLAKVVVSIDPLRSNDADSTQMSYRQCRRRKSTKQKRRRSHWNSKDSEESPRRRKRKSRRARLYSDSDVSDSKRSDKKSWKCHHDLMTSPVQKGESV